MSAIEIDLDKTVVQAKSGDVVAGEIAKKYGVSVSELKGRSRLRHIARARKKLYTALRNQGWSYPAIAIFCDNRDHSSVLNTLRYVSHDD